MKVIFVGFFLPFPAAVKIFFSQYLQAHNALKAWIYQRGEADPQAVLQRDFRRLRGVTKRLTKAKENSCMFILFWATSTGNTLTNWSKASEGPVK